MPLAAGESLTGARLALAFDVTLLEHAHEEFYGLVYLERIAPGPALMAGRLDVEGDLVVHQRSAVAHDGGRRLGDVAPALDLTQASPDAYNLPAVLLSYHSRNLTAALDPGASSVWRRGPPGGSAPAASFVLRCVVRYPSQLLWYRPGFWEEIKFAWIQYLAVFVPLYILLDAFRRFAFDNQVCGWVCVYLMNRFLCQYFSPAQNGNPLVYSLSVRCYALKRNRRERALNCVLVEFVRESKVN